MTKISTTVLPSMTDVAVHHGYPENNGRSGEVSPGGRRLTVQELLAEPTRSSGGCYSPNVISSSRAPSPTEPTGSTMLLQHGSHTTSPLQGGHTRYSQSPPTLPPPQLLRISHAHQSSQKTGMEIDSYKLPLPTPLTSPTPGPIIPVSSVQPLPHQYSPSTPVSTPTSSVSPLHQPEDQSSYMNTIATTSMIMPLSLSERRERNKVASAKYRAKKHKQNQEMSVQINELNAENNVLRRHNEELKVENGELKELVDKLKSKLVEGKILKRLGRGGAKLTSATAVTSTTIGTTTEGLTTLTTTMKKGTTRRGGFSGHARGTGPSPKNVKK